MTSSSVRVFSVDLDPPADVVEWLDSLLPSEEANASQPVRVARAMSRVLLADALNSDPARIQISRRCEHCGHLTHGRPTLVGNNELSFSLSHSGSFAVIALADDDAAIGVDVEAVRLRPRIDALAARVLNDDEHSAWLAIDDPDAQLQSFLRTWTAKEAYLKALGIGIATRLRDVPARVVGWSTCELNVGEGWIAALSIDRTEFDVEYLDAAPRAMSNGGTAG